MTAEQLDLFSQPLPPLPAPPLPPRLAVVIPCYNHANYITRAIQSVLTQSRPVDRLLVIDDGSTDNSVEIIRNLKDPRVELLTQENQNAFNTINRGVSLVAEDCDYIAILNSDDYYHPDRFARLLPLFENDPEAQVVCSGLDLIDENDAPLPPAHPRAQWFQAIWSLDARDDLELVQWLGLGNFPGTTSNILGRAAYMAANPMLPYHYNHDYAFLTCAAIRGNLRIHAEALLSYRVHAKNTMNTRPAKLMRELLRQQIDFLRTFHPEAATTPDLRRRYKLYMQAAFENISAFDIGLFFHVLGHSLQTHSVNSLDDYIGALDETSLPELTRFPNRHHVTNWPGSGPLGESSSMPEKLDALRTARDQAKSEAEAQKALAAALARATADKRYALGRLLGKAPRLDRLPGRNAGEKLDALNQLAQTNPWLPSLR